MQSYVEEIPDFEEEINKISRNHALSPLVSNNLPFDPEFDPNKPINNEYKGTDINLMQKIVGSLCWLGTCNPAYAVRHGMLAALTHKPSPIAFRIAKGVMKEIKETPINPIKLCTIVNPEIRIWVDAAVRDYCGRRGFILQLADKSWELTNKDNLVYWKSSSDKMKHASSTAAEVNAILQCLEDIDDVLIMTETLFGKIPTTMLSDSNSGIQQIKNGGHNIKAKRKSEYILEMLKHSPIGEIELRHVSGDIQLADALTKIKDLRFYN